MNDALAKALARNEECRNMIIEMQAKLKEGNAEDKKIKAIRDRLDKILEKK